MWIYRNLENTIHIAQIQASSHVTFKNFTTITYSANKSPSRGSRKRNIFLIVASSFRLSFAFWFYPHKQERKAMIISSGWSIFHILWVFAKHKNAFSLFAHYILCCNTPRSIRRTVGYQHPLLHSWRTEKNMRKKIKQKLPTPHHHKTRTKLFLLITYMKCCE